MKGIRNGTEEVSMVSLFLLWTFPEISYSYGRAKVLRFKEVYRCLKIIRSGTDGNIEIKVSRDLKWKISSCSNLTHIKVQTKSMSKNLPVER